MQYRVPNGHASCCPTIRRVTHINRDALFGELFRVLAQ